MHFHSYLWQTWWRQWWSIPSNKRMDTFYVSFLSSTSSSSSAPWSMSSLIHKEQYRRHGKCNALPLSLSSPALSSSQKTPHRKRIRRRQVLQIANDVGKICPYWPNILFIQSDLSLQTRCFQLHASCFKVSRRNSHWIIRWWLVSAYESLTSTVYVFVTLHLSPSSGVNLPILHFPLKDFLFI